MQLRAVLALAIALSWMGRAPAARSASAFSPCDDRSAVSRLAENVSISSIAPKHIGRGERIEIAWRLPPVELPATRVFLIGAMPDGVRFEGEFHDDESGAMSHGPGFVALTGASRAPFSIRFGSGRTRAIIPVHDTDIARNGKLWVKPYLAGALAIAWALVALNPGCDDGEVSAPVAMLGSFDIAPAEASVVAQNFVAPDPEFEPQDIGETQRIEEPEISADGRYRLEIFPRRYRVFDRASGAKIIDRSGVTPRFSPSGRFLAASIAAPGSAFPTNFEVIDLLVGRPIGHASGPILGWSNGDALLLDGGAAYQSVSLTATLIEPQLSPEGYAANWPYFSTVCVTCDAWASSNMTLDWDRLAALRGDSGDTAATEIVSLASGRKIGGAPNEDADAFRGFLQRLYGKGDVVLAKGWSSNATLMLTHVGRGFEGYAGDGPSLQPSDRDRPSQTALLAPRRLAPADGRVLRDETLSVGGPR